MAITTKITDIARVPGSRRQIVAESTLDSEYAAEGEPVTAAELGLSRIIWGFALLLQGSESETVEVGFPRFETKTDTTAVIRLFNYKSQKEVATGKDVSKVKVLVHAFGI